MRLVWVLTVAVLAGCGSVPQKCDPTTCALGCCDTAGVCQPGFYSAACGRSGQTCSVCSTAKICSQGACQYPNGSGGGTAGVGGGSSSGAGGGTAGAAGGSAGGATEQTVFVQLKYDRAVCCVQSCSCKNCRVETCSFSKRIGSDDFESMRLRSFVPCVVSQPTLDGYFVDCTGLCFERDQQCLVQPGNRRIDDHFASCPTIGGTSSEYCSWNP